MLVRTRSVVVAAFAVFSLFPVHGVFAADPVVHTIKTHFTQKQQQTERYVYVPFDVPAGVTRIDIDFKYQKTDENVVDLGLMEPGSTALHTKAFRGWSGGERSSIFVSASDATPGYWPGPIQAGTWRVALGLYKVGPAGVDTEVTIKTSSDAMPMTPPDLPTRADSFPLAWKGQERYVGGGYWYAGALHAHSHNSDGALSVQALAAKARSERLDFLALTDHNTTAQQREAIDAPDLLTIIGEEVTTPGGHANVWGLGGVRDFVDFRVLPGDPAIKTLFDVAVAKGAIFGINHPYGDCVACNWTHDIPANANTIEITSRDPGEMARSIALWDSLLRQGRRITAIGVSDWHRGDNPIAMANVRVFAPELSTRAILDGLRAGRVIIMMDAATRAPQIEIAGVAPADGAGSIAGVKIGRVGDAVSFRTGDEYRFTVMGEGEGEGEGAPYAGARVDLFWNGERVASTPMIDGRARFSRFVSTSGYLRASVVAPSGLPIAIANPIWIEVNGR